MVISQNLCRSMKRLAIDDNNISKKLTKKVKPNRVSFDFKAKTQTSLNS